MKFDLIHLWNRVAPKDSVSETSARHYAEGTKAGAINFDNNTIQSSFEFETSPKVIFVKNITTLEKADLYDDLPKIPLTTEEESIRSSVVVAYDNPQMVITGIIYESESNTLYLEARQVPYSFIVALNRKKFPAGSALYQLTIFKTGALAPLITSDNQSMLLQRAADDLYSVPGGFLEPHGSEKRLNFGDDRDLVTETAIAELKEEIVGIKDSAALRFNFSKTQITAVSFRKSVSAPMGTIEFVTPSYADCDSAYLEYVARNNTAEDADEHTLNHTLIPLDSLNRSSLVALLLTDPTKLPGAGLYLPVALSLTRLINNSSMIKLPRAIPNSTSVAWPLSFFAPKLKRALSAPAPAITEIEEAIERLCLTA